MKALFVVNDRSLGKVSFGRDKIFVSSNHLHHQHKAVINFVACRS
jgi:hypothetical protein